MNVSFLNGSKNMGFPNSAICMGIYGIPLEGKIKKLT